MGMFDYVNYECVCPVCKSKVDEFQTKSSGCLLDVLEPVDVSNFYSSCNEHEECGECDEPILPGELRVIYDGEPCHLSCAAEARDEADFDNWFINR